MTATETTPGAPLQALENSYLGLPPAFYARIEPTPVAAPRLLRLNRALAAQLGLDPDALASEAGVAMLAGNQLPAGAEPIAMAYAGHQFGNFVPQLGDGRAILLGEVVDAGGLRRDIQLKGSGRTPFSRLGDGRAALGPVLREYLVSEAFAALGIPTTRALAALTTGEWVYREGPCRAQFWRGWPRATSASAPFSISPSAGTSMRCGCWPIMSLGGTIRNVRGRKAVPSLLAVIAAQGDLIARWMRVGFIHGVMNTDNMSISGETIDYGPCAFMDVYHPGTVFSSIDRGGRYA